MVSTYKFGYQNTWSLDARWNLGSGFPFTQTQGFYPLKFRRRHKFHYLTENGELGILYSDINQGRLPYYHRLDIALKKEHKISKNSSFNWNFSVTNAYNREKNIFTLIELNTKE